MYCAAIYLAVRITKGNEDMSKVIVQEVIEKKAPYNGEYEGRKFTSYTTVVSGTVDGVENESIELKTTDADTDKGIAAGKDYECDKKENGRFVSYRIKPAAKRGFGGGFGGAPREPESAKYPSFAMAYAKDVVVALINNGAVPDKSMDADLGPQDPLKESSDAVCSVAATLLKWMKANA